ncbi:hypothetical protein DFP72DRAFT_1175094 [Ephemerocybe angulata]|uniref:Uncharacterized protein n=1 Tax=Ephemerocybe angulata TaxID=980116 RepID=A0A8H6HJE8_9AGAR|nr:hypothetical protein DFP72DRAFT_1175094 [Tulosesus angulatus]
MRFSLLPILTIVPLLNLAQGYGFDSPLHARGYKASLNTRKFHDAVDLQYRADTLADLSTRELINELSDRLERRATEMKGTPEEYICTRQRCEFRTTTPKKDSNLKQCIVNTETLELGYHQFVKTAEYVRPPLQRPAPSPLPKKRPAPEEDQGGKRQKQ